MVRRKIININEPLCNGCGNCIMACAEGAIKIIDGKARVISDKFCDGLGACIGGCPAGALTIEEKDTEEFDELAAKAHLKLEKGHESHLDKKEKDEEKHKLLTMAPCSVSFGRSEDAGPGRYMRKLGPSSQLSSWPIQMQLAHANAPYFKESRLLIAADCSAFACSSIAELIKGKMVLIGCPKLDETKPFVDKLAEILQANDIKDITILHMEVPCCTNLVRLVFEAVKRSGKQVAVSPFNCMIGGDVVKEESMKALEVNLG
jgi:NAD-dependent dihydropyrimidine dehydrogenase PreA subunit